VGICEAVLFPGDSTWCRFFTGSAGPPPFLSAKTDLELSEVFSSPFP